MLVLQIYVKLLERHCYQKVLTVWHLTPQGQYALELGGIPVHTEYRCLFFLRYEFLKYRNTGVI